MFGEPLHEYFGVGARLIYLRHAQQRLPIHGEGYVKNVLKLFFKDLEKFPFTTTRVASQKLREFYKSIKNKPINYSLTDSEAKELAKIATELTPIFEAESKHINTVVLIEKRYEIGKLMGNVAGLMAKGIFEALPEVAQKDMQEAGKCLALHRATAAAFHTLRATESMIKKTYLHYIRRNRLKKPMWFGMVEALRKKSRNKPSGELLDQLDIIRENYRNPTQHPEKIYDIEEAQDLFGNCVSALNLMTKSIKSKNTA